MRITLVEDHDLVRQGLRLLLESEPGWKVVDECGCCSKAIESLSYRATDLVVLDLHLPDLSGEALVARVRSQHPKVPILALSTHDEVAITLGAIRAGAGGYLVKSARREELIEAARLVSQGGVYLHPRVAPAVLGQLQNPDKRSPRSVVLSTREQALLQLVGRGCSNPEIAMELHVSLGTVKNDLSQLFRRLEVVDRAQLVAEASRRGLA